VVLVAAAVGEAMAVALASALAVPVASGVGFAAVSGVVFVFRLLPGFVVCVDVGCGDDVANRNAGLTAKAVLAEIMTSIAITLSTMLKVLTLALGGFTGALTGSGPCSIVDCAQIVPVFCSFVS